MKFQNFHIVIGERNEIIDGGLGNTTNTTMIMVFLATTVFDWRNIARIANAVQVTICLLVSASVY